MEIGYVSGVPAVMGCVVPRHDAGISGRRVVGDKDHITRAFLLMQVLDRIRNGFRNGVELPKPESPDFNLPGVTADKGTTHTEIIRRLFHEVVSVSPTEVHVDGFAIWKLFTEKEKETVNAPTFFSTAI